MEEKSIRTTPTLLDITSEKDSKVRSKLKSEKILDTVSGKYRPGTEIYLADSGLRVVFDAEPQAILDQDGNSVGIDALVRVFDSDRELEVDPHRVFINPPIMVPDGGFEEYLDKSSNKTVRIPTYKEDAEAAYLQSLEDSIKQAPNSKGWRTRGTVTTIYSHNDAYLQSYDTTYSTARYGGGDVTLNTPNIQNVGQTTTPAYAIYELFLTFDASVIGVDALINSVDLNIYVYANSASPVVVETRLLDYSNAALTDGDWVSPPLSGYNLLASWDSSSFVGGFQMSHFSDNGTALEDLIDFGGNTRLFLTTNKMRVGTPPSGKDVVRFLTSQYSGTTYDPRIVVSHEAPSLPVEPDGIISTGDVAGSPSLLAGAVSVTSPSVSTTVVCAEPSIAGQNSVPIDSVLSPGTVVDALNLYAYTPVPVNETAMEATVGEPSVQAGVVALGVGPVTAGDALVPDIYTVVFARPQGVASTSNVGYPRVSDPAIAMPSGSSAIPVSGATKYTAQVMARTTTAGVQGTLGIVSEDWSGSGSACLPVIIRDTWTPLHFVFITDPTTTGVRFEFTKVSDGEADIELAGWGLYAGKVRAGYFNSGAGIDHENLTPYVLGLRSEAGSKSQVNKMTPIEGVLNVTLNNIDRLFTPRNTSSPYYGQIRKKARVEVQYQVGKNWYPLWTGFYDSLEIDTGEKSARQAKLKANHGMMYLANNRITYVPDYNRTSTEIIRDLLEDQPIPSERYTWLLDQAKWGINTTVSLPAATLNLDESSYIHPIAGVNWQEDTSVRQAFEDMVENELGFAYYDREGRINFRTRDKLIPAIDLDSAVHVDLNTEAQSANYEHRGIQATEVEVSYHPQEEYDGLLWSTASEGMVRVEQNEPTEILVSPETPEGFSITPYTIDAFGSGTSYFDAREHDNLNNDHNWGVDAYIVQEGKQIRLTFYNYTDEAVLVHAALYGTGYFSKEKQTLLVRNEPLLDENNGLTDAFKLDLSLVADETEARSIANHLMAVMYNAIDGIFNVEYEFGEKDTMRRRKIMGIQMGDVILVSEKHSGIERMPHLVLGESYAFAGNKLTVKHTLMPVRPTGVWLLDVSRWGIETKVGY